ncbi:MAG: carboxy-S-adenosyl-L-methionine synthase CmoA [Gammaproteobacteria bacterium]|nr:carboxy-S-adenosyl-L-methionine synthase CmoA [Gammaproteobacteria bacterium]
MRDSLYSKPVESIQGFTFDEKVAAVFPDMIKRSVPGYATVIAMTGVLAGQYAQPESKCYDLGCSLGESSFAMADATSNITCSIIAIDNSQQMLDECQKRLRVIGALEKVELLCADIQDVDFDTASVAVMNYTLQFIDISEREALMKRLFDALLPGGVLLLSEKIKSKDEHTNQRLIDMHHNFKKANGYSDLEISQKRTALENVLLPETIEDHKQRLSKAGFENIDIWFQCFNFMSLIAYRP